MQCKSLLLAALLSASAATAQNHPVNDSVKQEGVKDILKINLTSLPLKNVSLQYEYILKKRVSLAVGVRVMPTTAIPFENLLINTIAEEDENTENLIRISRIGNIAITPEVRFYFGKGFGKGFYIAPYYRYVNFSSNTIILNYSAGGPGRSINMSGDMTGHTAGVMVGAQWFLGKHISLDWWIMGAHYGVGKGTFIGIPSTPLSTGEQEDIIQTLKNIDIPLLEKKIDVSTDKVIVTTDGPFGGVRAGILFGIRF